MKLNLRYVRYWLFFLSFLIFTYAVQVFVQNFNVNKTIRELDKKQNNLSWETLWMKKYYTTFLSSRYALFFFQHKQWTSFNDEILVKVKKYDNINKKWIKLDKDTRKSYNQDVKETWNKFFLKLKNFIY